MEHSKLHTGFYRTIKIDDDVEDTDVQSICWEDGSYICQADRDHAELIVTSVNNHQMLVEALEAAVDRIGRLEGILNKHHQHQLTIGYVKVDISHEKGKKDWVEMDLSAEYVDSSAFEETEQELINGDVCKAKEALKRVKGN